MLDRFLRIYLVSVCVRYSVNGNMLFENRSICDFRICVKNLTLKAAFIDAFEEIGGVDNLVEWARCNETEFYKKDNAKGNSC